MAQPCLGGAGATRFPSSAGCWEACGSLVVGLHWCAGRRRNSLFGFVRRRCPFRLVAKTHVVRAPSALLSSPAQVYRLMKGWRMCRGVDTPAAAPFAGGPGVSTPHRYRAAGPHRYITAMLAALSLAAIWEVCCGCLHCPAERRCPRRLSGHMRACAAVRIRPLCS